MIKVKNRFGINIGINGMYKDIIRDINSMSEVYSENYDEYKDNIHQARGMTPRNVTTMIDYFNTFKCAIEDTSQITSREFEVASRRIIDHSEFVINNIVENGWQDRGRYTDDDTDMVNQEHDEMIDSMEERQIYVRGMRNAMRM